MADNGDEGRMMHGEAAEERRLHDAGTYPAWKGF
jgi:hypothetical protein